jgi:hypothetical protein
MCENFIIHSAYMTATLETKYPSKSGGSNVNIEGFCVIANGFHDEALSNNVPDGDFPRPRFCRTVKCSV